VLGDGDVYDIVQMYIGLIIYSIIILGLFIVFVNMTLWSSNQTPENVACLANLVTTNPISAFMLSFLLFSLGSLPFFIGFFGKLVIFNVILDEDMDITSYIMMLLTVFNLYYYLRMIKLINTKFKNVV